jgi:RNA polymerase sigma factor (sigma-70 family)
MLTDKEIIEGCKNNDRKAQEQLYMKYAPMLLGVLIRYSRNMEEAEDILHEAFIKVFKRIHQYRKEGSFPGWLRRIMVNQALRHYKETSDHFRNLELKENIGNDISVKPDNSPYISRDELLKAIQNLPDGARTIFNLYAIEGYKHKEIAEMLDISDSTSKSQYARAKKYLQHFLSNKIKKSIHIN